MKKFYKSIHFSMSVLWKNKEEGKNLLKNKMQKHFLSISISLFIISFFISFNGYSQITVTGVDSVLSGSTPLTRDVTIPLVSGQYQISTVMQLRALSKYVMNGNNCLGLTFKLMNDITFTSEYIVYDLDGNGFRSNSIPIGYSTPFKGSFDGNNYKITGLKIKSSMTTTIGLFGGVVGTGSNYIKNIKIDSADLLGNEYV